ncbi:tetratricopeptide repeat protein, partial (macronuclear) [Tetrahymena thermophila SB210]
KEIQEQIRIQKMIKFGQILRFTFKQQTLNKLKASNQILSKNNLSQNINYNFIKILKDSGSKEIVDQDKLIQALEESLVSMSDPQQGLENVNNLMKMKSQKYNGNTQYSNYEQDLFTKANVFYSLKQFDDCKKIIQEIMDSQTATKEVKTRTLILKSSLIQFEENNYEKSLIVAKQAEQIIESENNSIAKELKVIIYHMIAEMQAQIFQNKNIAQVYLEKAIQIINDEIENNYLLSDKAKGQYMQRLANCYDSVAEIYHQEDKYDECKQIMGKCIELWKSNSYKQPLQYSNSLLRQGKISTDRGEYTQAVEKFSRAIKLMQGYENTDQFIVLCINTSKAYSGLEKYDKSLDVLKQALEQIHHLNKLQQNYYTNQLLEEFVDLYLKQGKFDEVSEIFVSFKKLGDSDYMKYIILKQEIIVLLCQEKYQEIDSVSSVAFDLAKQLYGENSKESAEILSSWGISLIYLNQLEEGFKQIQYSANILQDIGSIDEVQEIWNQVVSILEQQQNSKYIVKALGFLRRAIQLYVEKQGGEAGIIIDYIDKRIQQAKQQAQQ